MPGHLHLFHRGEAAVGLVAQDVELGGEDPKLVRHVQAPLGRRLAQPGDPFLYLDYVPFEGEMR